jgi:phosphatidylserine/phosphatidylglycerophosphate/cardiolipin synthase-like enzyme
MPLISPDNFITEITKLVKKATKRLYIQNQYIWPTTDSRWRELNEFVRDFSKKSNVDFKVIVRDQSVAKTMKLMKEMKFKLTDVRQLRSTHTKGIIVDDVGISIGSHNWSGDGFLANRDASLIFDDQEVIDYFEKVFLFDYGRARKLQLNAPESEPRLAPEGETPPPGMRRISWNEYVGN